MSRWTPEVSDYIMAHYKGTGHQTMADALNERFGTAFTKMDIKGFYSRHHLNSGLSGHFPKGNVPINKGRKGMTMHPNAVATQFRAGHMPANAKPVGTLEVRSDGYLYRKVSEPNVWMLEHVRVYEQIHGPVPNGHKVIFLDGDRSNCDPANLTMVDNETHMELNRRHLRTDDPELTQAGIMIAKARIAVRNAKRGKYDNHQSIRKSRL
jgi:hypothetical protein